MSNLLYWPLWFMSWTLICTFILYGLLWLRSLYMEPEPAASDKDIVRTVDAEYTVIQREEG